MADWVTIENIVLRGGPRDPERLDDVGAAGLVDASTCQEMQAHLAATAGLMSTINYAENRWLLRTPGLGFTTGCQTLTFDLNALIYRDARGQVHIR
jgi:hypothetical protein